MGFRLQTAVLTLAAVLCPLAAGGQAASGGAVTSLLQQGSAAMSQGNLPAAESAFRRASEQAPRAGEAWMGLGLVQLREGAGDAALNSLTKATEVSPSLGGAHMFLGIAQYQMGKPDEAVRSLEQEVALNPSSVEALTWIGIVQLGSGHPEGATGPLDRASALNPKDGQLLYYRARAHSLVAENTYRQLYQQEPDSALVHRALGESLASSGQPEKAITEFEAALKKEPSNLELYEELGEQDQKISRFEAAREAYAKELQLNPNSGVALYNLGKMDVEGGKPEAGVANLRKAEAAHASGAATDYYLGLGLAQLGSNEDAAHWLEQALAGQPSPFVEQGALFQLGRVYGKLGRKQDAQRVLERLQQLKASTSGPQ